MKKIFLTLLFFSIAKVSWGAPVFVRTGEHADFSRVVLSIPDNSSWTLGRTENGYTLRLPVSEGYDTSKFFDLIPRDRILDVTQNVQAGELSFLIDCVCNARAFLFRSDLLVVDIVDGPPSEVSPFEEPLLSGNEMTLEPESQRTSVRSREMVLPLIVAPELIESGPPSEGMSPLFSESQMPPLRPVSPFEGAPQTSDDISILSRAVAESLGRGLTEGLLEGDIGSIFGGGEQERSATIPVGTSLPGISARTAIDPLAIAPADSNEQTQSGEDCAPDRFFDVPNWGSSAPFHQQLGLARADLVEAPELSDEEAVVKLAQLYVYFGFGHEAIQVLAADGVNSLERQYLHAMAQLIEGEAVAPDLFPGQVSCSTYVTLWAFLAAPSPLDAKVDDIAVVRTFKMLPTYLARWLAPSLSEKLTLIGSQEAALQVLDTQDEDRAMSVDLTMAQATLADALGEANSAFQDIVEIVRGGPRVTPETLVRFFEEGVVQGLVFEDQDFLLSRALRFETAGNPVSITLLKAEFLALLSVDRFTEASEILIKQTDDLEAEQFQKLRTALFSGAVERMPDGAFLRLVWAEDFSNDSPDLQNTIATRLLGLGFPEKVMQVLSANTTDGSRALRAQAATLVSNNGKTIDSAKVGQSLGSTRILDAPTLPPSENVTSETASSTPSLGSVRDNLSLIDSRTLINNSIQSRNQLRETLLRVPSPSTF